MSKSRRRKRPAVPDAAVRFRQPTVPPVAPEPSPRPASVDVSRPTLQLPPPGMAVLPSELMARLQRQWIWFVLLAILCLLLAGSSITGWMLYIRLARQQGTSPSEVAGLETRLASLQDELNQRQARLEKVESELEATSKALDKAEALLAGADVLRSSDRSRVADAERGRADAEARAESAERTKQELETRLAASEQALAELKTKLAAAEAARTTAEEKLAAAETGRDEAVAKLAGAELRAGEVQRSLDTLKEHVARLEADVQRYRDEARDARADERAAVAKWQEAIAARLSNDRDAPAGPVSTIRPADDEVNSGASAASSVTQGAPPVQKSTASSADSAAPSAPPAAFPPPPASRPAEPVEGTLMAAVVGRDPSAARPESDEDPMLRDGTPMEMRGWGEAMIVGGNPGRAVELLRKAVEKGGEGAGYQKSLGWALLQAGRKEEAKVVLEAALAGFEDWPATSDKASPDHWTAAFLLGKVPEDEYTRRYNRVSMLGYRLDCLPWFYVGQRREMEGHREEAITAYRACVELGQLPNAYPIWRWANQRIEILSSLPTSAPAQ